MCSEKKRLIVVYLLLIFQLCKSNPTVDQELDHRLVEAMEDPNGPEIVESRLAGWWAYRNDIDCLRIWVEVDLNERLDRVAMREGDDVRRREESLLREEADRQRYTGVVRHRHLIHGTL